MRHHQERRNTQEYQDELNAVSSALGKAEVNSIHAHILLNEETNALMNRFEDKYFLPAANLQKLITHIKQNLRDGDTDTSVRNNHNMTIYLDNRDLDSFRDNLEGIKPRFKVRIRRYNPNGEGWENVAYIELKIKEESGFTNKVRIRIPSKLIDSVSKGMEIKLTQLLLEANRDISKQELWKRVTAINSVITKYGFKKQVVVEYNRRAYSSSNIRITVDDSLQYHSCSDIESDLLNSISNSKKWKDIKKPANNLHNNDLLILEVKHGGKIPQSIVKLLKKLDAEPVSFSKYCAAIVTYVKTKGDTSGIIQRQKLNMDVSEITEILRSEVGVEIIEMFKNELDLMKAPYIMDESTSELIGSGSMPLPMKQDKIITNKMKSGLFHHVTDRNGDIKHYLSKSPDVNDYNSILANINGTKQYNGMKVYSSKVKPEHKGKGYGKQLYLAALAHHGEMDSDENLTERSHKAWQSLPKASNGLVSVSLAQTTKDKDASDSQSYHSAKADQKKLRNALFTKDIIKPTKLAASESIDNELNKGFKQAAVGLGMLAGLASSANVANLNTNQPIQQVKQSQPTQSASAKFGSNPEDNFLHNIMQVESSGGTNPNHPLITEGTHKGYKAIGKFALMPLTLQEFSKRHKIAGGTDADILNIGKMNPHKISEYLSKKPDLELKFARALARHVIKRHGETPNAAYAWKYGHNQKARDIDPSKRDNDQYIQKYNKLSHGKSIQGLNPANKMLAGGLVKTEFNNINKSEHADFFNHPKTKEMLHNEIKNMNHEVKHSEQGKRSGHRDESGQNVNTSSKSTFPSHYAKIGVKNKQHFEDVMNSKKGPIYDRMKQHAHDRLVNGYSNAHGQDMPHPQYLVHAVKHGVIPHSEFHEKMKAIDKSEATVPVCPEQLEPTLTKPFQSEAQRGYLYSHPEKIGGKEALKEWESHTPKDLPKKKPSLKKYKRKYGLK